ncbi:MAG: polysaccharide biosynthesis C-terminal domain-containing protein [Erysipelotrichaceae bacterium]|nr:polysaccharide biosynthesis C-terminal domain-containing protein [Erysipelotrichaceae bacterium]
MATSRTRKAAKNIVYGLSTELIKLACGLILPRLILSNYGSAYNGIVTSVSNFLSVIALMKMGIGDATRAALFKPLANKDDDQINEVLASTEAFMRRIAAIFAIFVLGFSCIYPLLISDEFEWLFSASLVLIISISTFAEYYFGFTYQMLLSADQKYYIYHGLSILTTILNAVVSVILINGNYSIHIVKLGSAAVNIITPIYLYIYCHRKYNLKKKKDVKPKKIPQRWDAFTHEVASFVNDNTDTMILTVFTNLSEVSVYSIYHYVIINLKKIISSFVSSFGSAFGDMYARDERELMKKNLRIYETITFSFVSVIYSTTLALIVPFVLLYTKGVNDTNYDRELFAVLLTLGGAFNCIRYPYKSIINCTGHFKMTKKIAISEAVMNILISFAVVLKYGLIGVAVGTVCTMIFGTLMYSKFVADHIVLRDPKESYFHIVLTVVVMAVVYLLSRFYIGTIHSYLMWVVFAFVTVFLAGILTLLIDIVFYREQLNVLIQRGLHLLKRKHG